MANPICPKCKCGTMVKMITVWKETGSEDFQGKIIPKKESLGMSKYWVCKKNKDHKWKAGASVIE